METGLITVLLSTYNGHKYLQSFFNSLYDQNLSNLVYLFIRDDGSTDDTRNILSENTLKFSNVKLEKGPNLGFLNSFFELIKTAPDSKYYAFADQDDIWEKDKLERAVSKLDKENQDIPLLYFCDFSIIDENENVIEKHHKCLNLTPTFFNGLTMNQASGFTIVFNKKLKDLLAKVKPQKGEFHDYWAYLIALGCGRVIYDNYVCAKYRRHSKNESVGFANGLRLLKLLFSKTFFDDNFSCFNTTRKQYKELFYDLLSEKDKKTLDLFTSNSIKSNFLKAFYCEKYRKSAIIGLYKRICALFGKV